MDRLLELIPEFYYDLIARITPGAILIAVVIPFSSWQQFLEKDSLPISVILLFLISSYIIGFLIDAFSVTIEGFIEHYILSIKTTIFEALDEIANESNAKRLTKLVAELTLLRVLLTGWVIIGSSWRFPIFRFPFCCNWFFYLIILVFLLTAYLKWYTCTRKRIERIKEQSEVG
jgi:hypothetical protein